MPIRDNNFAEEHNNWPDEYEAVENEHKDKWAEEGTVHPVLWQPAPGAKC